MRLWAHECTRVFSDRLADVSEHSWFDRLISDALSRHMDLKWSEVQQQFYDQQQDEIAAAALGDSDNTGTGAVTASAAVPVRGSRRASTGLSVEVESSIAGGAAGNTLLFGDFAEATALHRTYRQVNSDSHLQLVLQHYMREYNAANFRCVCACVCASVSLCRSLLSCSRLQ